MSTSTVSALTALVEKLQAERQAHVDAIQEIDHAVESLGLSLGKPVDAARNGTATTRKTRKTRSARGRRGSYAQTAEQFVQALLPAERPMTSTEINRRWKQAGRGGTADNTLSKLTKAGILIRENIEGARGSNYRRA